MGLSTIGRIIQIEESRMTSTEAELNYSFKIF